MAQHMLLVDASCSSMQGHAQRRSLQLKLLVYLNLKFVSPISCPEDTGAQPRICGSPVLQELHSQSLCLSRNNRHSLVYAHAGEGYAHVQVHLIMHITTDDCIPDEAAIDPQGCVREQQSSQCHHGPQLATAKLLHNGCRSRTLQCTQRVTTCQAWGRVRWWIHKGVLDWKQICQA